MPWGILIGGEELHNNHHAFASSAKMSVKPWEFDIGWLYIRVLQALRLAKVKKLPPEVVMVPGKVDPDIDTVHAVISNRFHVMSEYAKRVLSRVYAEEIAKIDSSQRGFLESARSLLMREESMLSREAKLHLERARAPQRRDRDRLSVQAPAPGAVAAAPCDPRSPGRCVARVVPAGGRERRAGAGGVRQDAARLLDAPSGACRGLIRRAPNPRKRPPEAGGLFRVLAAPARRAAT